jgi:hypothetical protein
MSDRSFQLITLEPRTCLADASESSSFFRIHHLHGVGDYLYMAQDARPIYNPADPIMTDLVRLNTNSRELSVMKQPDGTPYNRRSLREMRSEGTDLVITTKPSKAGSSRTDRIRAGNDQAEAYVPSSNALLVGSQADGERSLRVVSTKKNKVVVQSVHQGISTNLVDRKTGTSADLTRFGDRVVFLMGASDAMKVYVTDGTVAGTKHLDLFGSSPNLNLMRIESVGTRLIVSGSDMNESGERYRVAWISDTTPAGTYLAPPLISSADLIESNGNVALIQERANELGRRLWVTDGTLKGTRLASGDGKSSYTNFGKAIVVGDVFLVNARRDYTSPGDTYPLDVLQPKERHYPFANDDAGISDNLFVVSASGSFLAYYLTDHGVDSLFRYDDALILTNAIYPGPENRHKPVRIGVNGAWIAPSISSSFSDYMPMIAYAGGRFFEAINRTTHSVISEYTHADFKTEFQFEKFFDSNRNGRRDVDEIDSNVQLTWSADSTNRVTLSFKNAEDARRFTFTTPTQVTKAADRPTLMRVGIAEKSFSGKIEGTLYRQLPGIQHGIRSMDVREPLPGVAVYLDANFNRRLDPDERTTTTDTAGKYQFVNLPAARYGPVRTSLHNASESKVRSGPLRLYPGGSLTENPVYQIDGKTAAISGFLRYSVINVASGQEFAGPFVPLVGMKIFLDQDGDRIHDLRERFTRTDANGEYRFADLPMGHYFVRAVQDAFERVDHSKPHGFVADVMLLPDTTVGVNPVDLKRRDQQTGTAPD